MTPDQIHNKLKAFWVYRLMRFVTLRFIQDQCTNMAARLTFALLLSIVPLITVVFVALSTVPALSGVRSQIETLIYSSLLPRTGLEISQYLNDFTSNSSNLTAMGIAALFITSMIMIGRIEGALNEIWRIKNVGIGVRRIARYWVMITLGPLLLAVVFALSGALQSMDLLNQTVAGYQVDWAVWAYISSYVLSLASFTLLFWFVPNTKVSIKNAIIAGIFTGVVFDIFKQLFTLIIGRFTSYEFVYGAFAALPIFLVWINVSWLIILYGAEFCFSLGRFDKRGSRNLPALFTLIELFALFYKAHMRGETVSEQQVNQTLKGINRMGGFDPLSLFKRAELITETPSGKYALIKSPSKVTLWDLVQMNPSGLPDIEELERMCAESPYQRLREDISKSAKQLKQRYNFSMQQFFDDKVLQTPMFDLKADAPKVVTQLHTPDQN